MELENVNPYIYQKADSRKITDGEQDEEIVDEFDSREIFGKFVFLYKQCYYSMFIDLIRGINDPEHPLTLEELHVLEESLIKVENDKNTIDVLYTPTIPHCSMATLIGLSIRVKLMRCLPPRFKVTVKINPGTHSSEHSVNKQLADKERIAAALENTHLIKVINQCIANISK